MTRSDWLLIAAAVLAVPGLVGLFAVLSGNWPRREKEI